jgi:choline dehydrogenase-like flavoprotein
MLHDARSIPLNSALKTDICIVGGGTAGLVLARELIGRKFHVTVIESGGLTPDKDTQNLGWGHMIGHPDHSLDTARPRYLGGSSNRWDISVGDRCDGVRLRPLDDIDFERRDGISFSGWPFSKSHLVPYYKRAQEICKITPDTYDVNFWETNSNTKRLSFKDNKVNTVIFKFGTNKPIVDDCAKQVISSENVNVYLYGNVVDIEVDKSLNSVKHVKVACLNGNRFKVSAKIYILANGGIEIPRLLLSSCSVFKDGIGNNYDLVGRFFMQHLHFYPSGILVPFDHNLFRKSALYNHIRIVNGVPLIAKFAISEDVLRKEHLLNYVAELLPTKVLSSWLGEQKFLNTQGVRSLKRILSALPGFRMSGEMVSSFKDVSMHVSEVAALIYNRVKGRHLDFMKKRSCVYFLANMSEQIPNPDSRVTLSDDVDELGMRRVKLDWRLHEYDIWSAIRCQQILDSEFQKAGIGKLYIQLNEDTMYAIHGGWHHMGTTRMSEDPKAGVVDKNCLMHGLANLYIAGPSVFPTGGYANPTLTIVALTVRLAEHIKKRMNEF